MGVGGKRHATSRSLYSREKDPVPSVQEAGWAPRLVWTRPGSLAPHWDSISRPSSPQQVAILTELSNDVPLNQLRYRVSPGYDTTITLPVFVYGCDTWSVTLRKERRLRVLEKVFGPKRDEVTGERRRLLNEALHQILFR